MTETLQKLPGYLQVSLLGDQVHLLTSKGSNDAGKISAFLMEAGIASASVLPGEITLEDVSMNLTHKAHIDIG